MCVREYVVYINKHKESNMDSQAYVSLIGLSLPFIEVHVVYLSPLAPLLCDLLYFA